MRHDDEGDEGEGSGELPDPSTRHWRHPSELGRQRALPHHDPTPILAGQRRGGSTTVWPVVAVGGCLVIVTLGMIGLQTDLGRGDRLEAGTAATVVPTQTTLGPEAVSAVVAGAVATSTSAAAAPARPEAGDEPEGGLTAWSTTTTTTTRPTRVEADDPGQTSDPRAAGGAPTSLDLPEVSPHGSAKVPVYGVYAAPGREEALLGSFIMIGDDPIASASSLGDRTTIWLRVETSWLEALVVASDPITDVALLDVIDDIDGIVLPTISLADEPIGLGAPAMVGYGHPELLADEADDGQGPAGDEPDQSQPWPDEATKDQAVEPQDDAKVWAAASDRRGLIYSLTKPLTTGSGRLINDPIRLHTAPGPADAGAPLRNRDGEIIGLVAHSTLPQVAAVPIDRVVEAVGWLRQSGVGDPAWLGLTVSPQPGGLIVTTIEEGSPADALAPGDLIVAIDHQFVFHPDSLEFAARLAGPGQVLDVTIDRQNRRRTVQIEVGTIPRP